ncbi:Fe2+-enterobactin ABC transporter substrate-binding protein [Rhodococcus triatomae]|uniref:Iron complex transport system substrate-binding protein n=1 Tax=Rhodococcus triatomae TaxID=300028 RepID=A0A1G8IBI5_9NOCA|nr:Fe2+-enterobactin ABC transporter substrate-binding protein [Rhodococcus triatomae]QNG21002.1 Fe2+-enterobactin ABC transporter substrate-binding protein [Rhodococcus triatomae]QNG23083.1 Fe2+-enterobactin ABC transporter substrate-binding protein [Rhodococcus triatomae]SDI15920.1 iron complex transport system substrate-binding protein [Rhodococcus triatomae]
MLFRRTAAAVLGLVVAVGVASCSSDTDADESSNPTASSEGSWPRTITDDRGTVTIDAQPERIVSTSVTLTGSLLSLDAPVIGTGTQPPSTITDDDGLFLQWADVAKERDVEVLYQGEPNIERITAANPDLIFVSATGADAAAAQYDTLAKIAPVVVLRYDNLSWQDLTEKIAEAVGAEDKARELIAEFDGRVDEARESLTDDVLAQSNPVNVLTYNSPEDSRIFTSESSQGALLESLGLEIAELPASITDIDAGDTATRDDVVGVSQELLTQALPGNSTFIINAQQPDADRLLADPTLAATPSVEQGQVYPLGYDSFRLDYYSANLVIDRVVDALT